MAVDRATDGPVRWYVRMRGDEKEFTTVWLTLGQRTLRYETYVLPAPEENAAELYENLLRRNERLVGAHFSIGIEDAVFLRGEMPVGMVSLDELDRALGTLYAAGRAVLPGLPADRVRQPLLLLSILVRLCPLTFLLPAHPRSGAWVGVLGGVGTHSTHPGYRRRMTSPVRLTGHECRTTGRPTRCPSTSWSSAAGTWASALLGGMIESGTFGAPERLGVVETGRGTSCRAVGDLFPGVVVATDVPPCRSAVLAVKPADAVDAAGRRDAGATRVLSIAAGVRLATLDEAGAAAVAVIRAMPNTPALVGEGLRRSPPVRRRRRPTSTGRSRSSGRSAPSTCSPEPLIDAFTGVAGSGPAYLFLVAEALDRRGRRRGHRSCRRRACGPATAARFGGAARPGARPGPAARSRSRHPAGRPPRGSRCSKHGLRDIVAAAVRAATERSRELG